MQIEIGVAKVNKYASSESGDTLEVVERPHGGLSIVLADGQRSGKSAKRISNMVVRKVIALLAEGVRDGAAARAASDYLFAHRQGTVQSTLNILSIDLVSNTLVLTRNNPAPLFLASENGIEVLAEESLPVGIYRGTRPVIREIALKPGLCLVAYTDGLIHAGDRSGLHLDMNLEMAPLLLENISAQRISDTLLAKALELDHGRAIDDISVVSLRVIADQQNDGIRRMSIALPIQTTLSPQ